MGYSFLEFMKRIGIFIVCTQSLLHFTAGKSYEKYIKLLIGIMILAQFATPLRTVFLKGEKGELWEEIERFQMELEEAAGNVVWDYEEEDETATALESEIKEKLEPVAGKYGFSIKEVSVYGDLPKVEVIIQKEGQKGEQIRVEKIRIGNGEKTGKEETENLSGQYDEMIERFGSALNTDESYIIIREE